MLGVFCAAANAHTISDPLFSDLCQGDSPCSAPTATPYQEALGTSRHDGWIERQEGLPSHPPKRTNGADRRSDHSFKTQQGAQQPAGKKNLRETNVELREENPKTSQENLINICFAGLHERAILPEATGRCKRLD